VACALARFCTVTEKLLADVPPIAVAETVLVFDDVVLTELNVVRLDRRLAASDKVETRDLICP